MKNICLPLLPVAAFAAVVSMSSCGKTDMKGAATSTATSAATIATASQTLTYTDTGTSTNTNTSVQGGAPLSFSFKLNGNQTAITPVITTDNVLRVKFIPGTTQGNSFHSASLLETTLSYNSVNVTPKYESGAYNFGKINEASDVIDLSGSIGTGSGIQISVGGAQSDFYCTYAPNPFYYWDGTQYAPVNPLYNSYPGCYRAVPSTQQWSGTIVVQTSSTSAI